ncbi:hypothetical protein [Amycolatopsis sp. cg13]
MVASPDVDTMAVLLLPVAADVADDGQRGRSPARSGWQARWCFGCC